MSLLRGGRLSQVAAGGVAGMITIGAVIAGGVVAASPTATTLDLTTIDPCQVVTKADAEALARTPLFAGVPGIPDEPSCTYNAPVTGPLAQVSVYIGPGAKKTLDVERVLKHRFVRV